MDSYQVGSGQAQYDVSTDDERFVMLKLAGGESQLILVENFFEVSNRWRCRVTRMKAS